MENGKREEEKKIFFCGIFRCEVVRDNNTQNNVKLFIEYRIACKRQAKSTTCQKDAEKSCESQQPTSTTLVQHFTEVSRLFHVRFHFWHVVFSSTLIFKSKFKRWVARFAMSVASFQHKKNPLTLTQWKLNASNRLARMCSGGFVVLVYVDVYLYVECHSDSTNMCTRLVIPADRTYHLKFYCPFRCFPCHVTALYQTPVGIKETAKCNAWNRKRLFFLYDGCFE